MIGDTGQCLFKFTYKVKLRRNHRFTWDNVFFVRFLTWKDWKRNIRLNFWIFIDKIFNFLQEIWRILFTKSFWNKFSVFMCSKSILCDWANSIITSLEQIISVSVLNSAAILARIAWSLRFNLKLRNFLYRYRNSV